jgi:hypothetical protein
MTRRSICFAASALALVIAGIIPAQADPPAALEYVAVAANTGTSAGGHSALRAGDHVYHYQAGDDMILLLRRDPWDYFLRRYGMLDNRSMTLSRLDLSPDSSRTIIAYLDRLRVVQHKHVDRLAALKVEAAWFDDLDSKSPGTILLPAAGLFSASSREDPHAIKLRSSVSTTLGPDFLQQELNNISRQLADHALELSAPGNTPILVDQFPATPVIAAERLRNRLLLREALLSLSHARALDPNALVSPGPARLSPHERKQLLALAQNLQSAVLRLLQSPRPDRGAPILLATARFEAVNRSLIAGQWLLLDAIPRENVLIDAKKTQKHHELVSALAAQAGDAWMDQLAQARSLDTLSAAQYGRLEAAASRHTEPLNALREHREVWAAGPGQLVPVRRGPATSIGLHLDEALVHPARKESKRQLTRYDETLRDVYEYSLLRHNCTTEIAGAIQSAFPDDLAVANALGGVIPPGKGFAFIPINLSKKIEKHWTVADTHDIPSRRKQQVAELVAQDNATLVRLREANTLTASYPGSIHDDAFLFFADGKKILRPFQGTANLGYGALNAGLGALALPFDGGHHAWTGLRGAINSVPEIIGLSIRKGRYDIVPADATLSPSLSSENSAD